MTEHLRLYAFDPIEQAGSVSPATIAPQTVETSFLNLLVRIQSLKPPRIIGEPDGDDLRGIGDHMVQVADAVDAYFEQLGRMVQSNSPVKIDQTLFKSPCFEAIGGNAVFEINRAADALDEDLSEVL